MVALEYSLDDGATWMDDVWAAFLADALSRIKQKHPESTGVTLRYTAPDGRVHQGSWRTIGDSNLPFRLFAAIRRIGCKIGSHLFFLTIEEGSFTLPYREVRTIYKECGFCGKRQDTGQSIMSQVPERKTMRVIYDENDVPLSFAWKKPDGSFGPFMTISSIRRVEGTDQAHLVSIFNKLVEGQDAGIDR